MSYFKKCLKAGFKGSKSVISKRDMSVKAGVAKSFEICDSLSDKMKYE